MAADLFDRPGRLRAALHQRVAEAADARGHARAELARAQAGAVDDALAQQRGIDALRRAGRVVLDLDGDRVELVAGRLQPARVEPFVGDARKRGVDRRNLVHDFGRAAELLRVARGGHQHAEDLPVCMRISRGIDHLPDALDAALAVGERAVLLEEARARQDDVGELRGLGEEQLLDDEEVQRLFV